MTEVKIGDIVEVTDGGSTYSTYDTMARKMGLGAWGWDDVSGSKRGVREGEQYLVVAKDVHPAQHVKLFGLIPHGDGSHTCKTVTIMSEEGFKVVVSKPEDPVAELKTQLDKLYAELVELRAFKQRVMEAVK